MPEKPPVQPPGRPQQPPGEGQFPPRVEGLMQATSLTEREMRFFDTNSRAVLVFTRNDAGDFVCAYGNTAYRERTGRALVDIQGKPYAEISPTAAAERSEAMVRVYESGVAEEMLHTTHMSSRPELGERLHNIVMSRVGGFLVMQIQDVTDIMHAIAARRRITAGLDLSKTVDEILNSVRDVTGAQMAELRQIDPATGEILDLECVGFPEGEAERRRTERVGERTAFIDNLPEGEVVVCNNRDEAVEAGVLLERLERYGVNNLAAIRFHVGDVSYAVIVYNNPEGFTDRKVLQLEATAEDAHIAIENAGLHTQLQASVNVIEATARFISHDTRNKVNTICQNSGEVAAGLRRVSGLLGEAIDASAGQAELVSGLQSAQEIIVGTGGRGGLLERISRLSETTGETDLADMASSLTKVTRELRSTAEVIGRVGEAAADREAVLTPLTSIREIIEGGEEKTGLIDYVSLVSGDANDVVELLMLLSDVAKIATEGIPVNWSPLDVRDIAGRVTRSFASMAKAKGLELVVEPAEGLPPADCDPKRINQALTNLVKNAIKFTDEGSVRVMFTEEGDCVHVDVADTGIGMTPEDQRNVFDLEFQAKHGRGGEGLGLYVSRGIAQAHGGELSILRSAPGEGTTFRLTLLKADRAMPVSTVVDRAFTGMLPERHTRSADVSIPEDFEVPASISGALRGGVTAAGYTAFQVGGRESSDLRVSAERTEDAVEVTVGCASCITETGTGEPIEDPVAHARSFLEYGRARQMLQRLHEAGGSLDISRRGDGMEFTVRVPLQAT